MRLDILSNYYVTGEDDKAVFSFPGDTVPVEEITFEEESEAVENYNEGDHVASRQPAPNPGKGRRTDTKIQ
jgi:hypothetical protein